MYKKNHSALLFTTHIGISLISALGITLALFMLMKALIFTDMKAPIESPPVPIPNIHSEGPPKIVPNFPKIDKPEDTETPPEPQITEETFDGTIEITLPNNLVNIPTGPVTLQLQSGRFPIAQLLSAPKYPISAINRNIEGWVDVQYDITKFGTTENIRAVQAQPKGVFERSALAAVKRWRYQPLIDNNGKAQAFKGLSKRVVFEMAK